jgi:dihydroorotase
MQLKETQRIELPPSADMHVHLRQGDMMKLVTPTIRNGGVDTVFVMVSSMFSTSLTKKQNEIANYVSKPNLTPPVTTVTAALEYKSQLEALEDKVHYLMSLYVRRTPMLFSQE